MFARAPFLFGGCQFDLFERTAFLFVARSTGKFVSVEDLEACRIVDLVLDADTALDEALGAMPAVDITLEAALGDLEVGATPALDLPIGARPVGDLALFAEHQPDQVLFARDDVDQALDGLQLVDLDLDALRPRVDVELGAEVVGVDLDSEITNSRDCC